jgi:predicted amidohydrolase
MRAAAVQHEIIWEEPERTRELVRPMIAKAAADGAGLIVLSEMYATGFSMRPERIAEDEGGPNEQFLLEGAAEHGAVLVASIAQRGADGQYRNNAVVARPDGSVERYAKIHPFSYAGEHERYDAGQDFLTVQIEDLKVTVFVCYDLRFADEFWACAADTDVYVVPANWPEPRREHWRTLLRARAIENQAYVVGCNRVGDVHGSEGGRPAARIRYTGDSAIIDPLGRVLAEGSISETVLVADVEAAEVKRVRDRFPFLLDRR